MTPTKENKQENVTMPKSEMNNKNNMSNGKITPKTIAKNVANVGLKGTRLLPSVIIVLGVVSLSFSHYAYCAS